MCHAIYITLPLESNAEAVRTIVKRHGRALLPVGHTMKHETVIGERLYGTKRFGCDCGTFIGILANAESGVPSHADTSHARDLAKLRRKGWSEAKVARWLWEKENQKEKEARSAEVRRATYRGKGNVNNWLELIRESLESDATPSIGLLLLWEGGKDGTKILGRTNVALSELREDILLQAREGVVYTFLRT